MSARFPENAELFAKCVQRFPDFKVFDRPTLLGQRVLVAVWGVVDPFDCSQAAYTGRPPINEGNERDLLEYLLENAEGLLA